MKNIYKNIINIILLLLLIFLSSSFSFAYKVDYPETVHQHITNESKYVWYTTPNEIKNHLNNQFNFISGNGYNFGDDIITGSMEEDTEWVLRGILCLGKPFCTHFWEADEPQVGNYNKGLTWIIPYDSSYVTAKNYWQNNIMPFYIGIESDGSLSSVEQDKTYYFLGRIVHLLEDATVPAHTHLDIHAPGYGLDSYEEYTATQFSNYHGSSYSGQQYDYENLPNTGSFNWNEVQPSGLSEDQAYLFKLFYYTAQKSQYTASNDEYGSDTYTNLSGLIKNFPDSLWTENITSIVNDKTQVSTKINEITNYEFPHAMKSVAGLYRLFWNTVREKLRLYVPGGASSVRGSVTKDSIWFTEMEVYKTVNKNLKIKLIPTSGDINDINEFVATNPSGSKNYSSVKTNTAYEISIPKDNVSLWTWKLYAYGKDSITLGDYIQFTVSYELIDDTATSGNSGGVGGGTGGINFTEANLNYISTCDKDLEFVMKAREANETEEIINITNATNQAMDAFLTGLIIPNYKQWVSMIPLGSVKIDSDFARTKAGQVLIKADADMKSSDAYLMEDLIGEVYDYWDTLTSQSPYTEVQSLSGNKYPNWWFRTEIVPGSIEVNETDNCKIFITNSTLNVVTELMEASFDTSNYNSVTQQDINNRLNTWKTYFRNRLETEHKPEVYNLINNNDTFKDLRVVYNSLALAQWYKKQDRNALPFIDIIDNPSKLSELNLTIDYDENYWKTQSDQFLYWITNHNGYWVHGGVSFNNINSVDEGILSNLTEEIVYNATIKEYEKVDDIYYYGGIIKPSSPDLQPLVLAFSNLTASTNEIINSTAVIINNGNEDAVNARIYFYDEYTYSNGFKTTNKLGETLINLTAGEITLTSILWNSSNLGMHNVTVEVDYGNNIKESNEQNNIYNYEIQIVNPYPSAVIYSPLSGEVYYLDNNISFSGFGSDEQDGYVENLTWYSSINGYLGNGSVINKYLSLGNHIITLTATDSDGYTDTKQVQVSIILSNPPTVKIISPINNKIIHQGETVFFEGIASDPEDGKLQNNSLVWSSSVDGILGYGEKFNTNGLSIGSHVIRLNATDSSGVSVEDSINLEIVELTKSEILNDED